MNDFLPTSLLHSVGRPDHLVWLAVVVVVAALAGEAIARLSRLPRLVGYTLAGWLAALFGQGAALPLAGASALVVDLALALLLFEIGSRVRLRWLRRNPGLLATSLLEAAAGALAVYAALIWLELPPWTAAACAVLAIPSSAAVAGRVALELGADGQVTQRLSVLTALNTLYGVLALILFKAAALAGLTPDWGFALHSLALSSMLSVLFAILLAGAVALVARRLDLGHESAVLLLLGLVLLAVTSARWLGASTLLVPLLAGLALRNLTDRPWVWPRHFGTAGGVLVLLLFVVVGSAWTPALLAAGGLATLALLVARGLGKGLVVLALSRWSRSTPRQGMALAIALTPLSATALVLLSELMRAQPALASTVLPVVASAVVLLELIGPLAVQMGLRLAGELSARVDPEEPK